MEVSHRVLRSVPPVGEVPHDAVPFARERKKPAA
jgi:hypothetical protein